jgi:hypothetical protein
MKIETLKLDYDNITFKEIYKILQFRGIWVIRFFKLKVKNVDVFKTKKGYHIYIDVNNRLNNQDIVFLQLALCSDFMRECYYWKRIKYPKLPNRNWNILFFKKHYGKNTKKKPSIETYSEYNSKRLAKILIKR